MNKYKKAFHEACKILDDMTGDGSLLCPLEYLGRCACITTENGFECPDDTNANWEFALLEKVKNGVDEE